jgi:hypothetical protein
VLPEDLLRGTGAESVDCHFQQIHNLAWGGIRLCLDYGGQVLLRWRRRSGEDQELPSPAVPTSEDLRKNPAHLARGTHRGSDHRHWHMRHELTGTPEGHDGAAVAASCVKQCWSLPKSRDHSPKCLNKRQDSFVA